MKPIKNFFHNTTESILFMTFIFVIPVASVFGQFTINDKTLYLTIFITIFGLVYNFISILSSKKIITRILWEGIILFAYMPIAAFICLYKTVMVISVSKEKVVYDVTDCLFVCFLVSIPLCIYIIETTLIFKKTFIEKRWKKRDKKMQGGETSNLVKGSSKV